MPMASGLCARHDADLTDILNEDKFEFCSKHLTCTLV